MCGEPSEAVSIHFSPTLLWLCLQAFVGFCCVRDFQKLRRSSENADDPYKELVQFLQAVLASHAHSVVVQGRMLRRTDSKSVAH